MARFNDQRATTTFVGVLLLSWAIAGQSLVTTTATIPVDSRLRSSPPRNSATMCFTKKEISEEETSNESSNILKKQQQPQTWNPLRLGVLRLGLTEPAMTSPLNYGKYDGAFNCAYCGQTLFDSTAKFDSGSGWPSFWRTATADSVHYQRESDGRLECQCNTCRSHLGHVFLDGPRTSTFAVEVLAAAPESDPRMRGNMYLPRFCMNGAALTYKPREQQQQQPEQQS